MVKPYKPDLSEKITIRCSKELRAKVSEICRREDMEESEALRYLLTAGVVLAERNGIESVMITRREFKPAEVEVTTNAKRRR